MTTTSVEDLVEWCNWMGDRYGQLLGGQAAEALTRLSELLRNTVDIYDAAAKLDEDSHDFNDLAIALLDRETDNINAIRALLAPSRSEGVSE